MDVNPGEGDQLSGYQLLIPRHADAFAPDESLPPQLRAAGEMFNKSIKRISTVDPHVEDLALYHLWWRAYPLFRDVLQLTKASTPMAATFVTRALSEVVLHARLIRNPPPEKKEPSPFDAFREHEASSLIRHRLRGYLAWVTANEIKALEQRLGSISLRMTFEPQTAREHAKWLDAVSRREPAIHELFTDPETLTDAEAEAEKEEFVARTEDELKQVRDLFSHSGLGEWRKKIDEVPERHFALERLIGGTSGRVSIRSSWNTTGVGVGALWYDEASAMVHGNRLHPAITFLPDKAIAPSFRVIGDSESAEGMMIGMALLSASEIKLLTSSALDP